MSPTNAALHNQLHGVVGLGLATNLVDGNSGHIAAHNLIHGAADPGLPTNIVTLQNGHDTASTALASWLAEATPGIRGTAGPRDSSLIPEWPGSFTSSHSTFSSLESAVNAGGTARKFRITASIPFTATIAPHANDEFWCDNGVVISMSGGSFKAFAATSANGVKIMNGTFSSFVDRLIDSNGSTGWEVGYCSLDGGNVSDYGTTVVKRCHRNIYKNFKIDPISMFSVVDGIVEDNEIGPSMQVSPGSGAGNKYVGTQRMRCRHNWIHDMGPAGGSNLNGTGQWLDYNNRNAIVEWNLIEDCNGPGIFLEVNYWDDDIGAPGVFTNIVRYNLIRDNNREGIGISGSSFTEVYENTLNGNVLLAGEGEINVAINQAQVDTQNAELKQNHIRYNHITTAGTRRGAFYDVADTIANYSQYVDGTKDNTWDFNAYNIDDPAAANRFRKEASNLTFAQWQAGGTPAGAAVQDVNGSAV